MTIQAPVHTKTNSPALVARGVTKKFRSTYALRGVDLELAEGECVTLLGPSGSGKSTLLKVIAGFETSTEGAVSFHGRDLTRLSPAERDCGMVFQNYALFPHMTVADNVAYGLRLRRWPAPRRQARVSEMLALVGLEGYDARYPRQLSGGQQQRVAIARALAYDPPLLLMDEPLGALDRSLRLEMVEQIRRIHRETGKTIVYVTHDQQEALALSDRIAVMKDGLIVEIGTPARLYREPRTVFVASFFGGANLLPAGSENGPAITHTGPPRPENAHALAVRPRILHAMPAGGIRSGLSVRGTIVDALLMGDEVEILVAVEGWGQIKVLAPATVDVEPGREILLAADAADVVWVTE